MAHAPGPISALSAYLARLRPCVISAEDANACVAPVANEACRLCSTLSDLLMEFGWSTGVFYSPVDLQQFQIALQKYKYERLQELGKGSYGVVFKARNRETNEEVALKRLRYCLEGEGLPSSTIREICLLRDLCHENIVQLKDVMWAYGSNTMYVVLECLDCDLRQYLDTCPEASHPGAIRAMMYQLLAALHHAHSHLVMHRDLKPQNVLVDTTARRVKIADFGLARSYLPPFKNYTDKVVTLYYRAPELLLGAPQYSTAVDIWALGCIFAEMANFEPLFRSDTEIGLLFKIFETRGTPGPADWADLHRLAHYQPEWPKWAGKPLAEVMPRFADDPLALDLLDAMLAYDPKRRITAHQALSHPWFAALHRPQPAMPLRPDLGAARRAADGAGPGPSSQEDAAAAAAAHSGGPRPLSATHRVLRLEPGGLFGTSSQVSGPSGPAAACMLPGNAPHQADPCAASLVSPVATGTSPAPMSQG